MFFIQFLKLNVNYFNLQLTKIHECDHNIEKYNKSFLVSEKKTYKTNTYKSSMRIENHKLKKK